MYALNPLPSSSFVFLVTGTPSSSLAISIPGWEKFKQLHFVLWGLLSICCWTDWKESTVWGTSFPPTLTQLIALLWDCFWGQCRAISIYLPQKSNNKVLKLKLGHANGISKQPHKVAIYSTCTCDQSQHMFIVQHKPHPLIVPKSGPVEARLTGPLVTTSK